MKTRHLNTEIQELLALTKVRELTAFEKARLKEFQSIKKMLDYSVFNLIRDWSAERGLYEDSSSEKQYLKLGEEFGELGKALLKKNHVEVEDAIGDMVVVLTNIAFMYAKENVRDSDLAFIEDCILAAYNEIKDRRGTMKNGTFVKKE